MNLFKLIPAVCLVIFNIVMGVLVIESNTELFVGVVWCLISGYVVGDYTRRWVGEEKV